MVCLCFVFVAATLFRTCRQLTLVCRRYSLSSQCSTFTYLKRDMRLGWDDLTHASEFCTQVLSAAAGSSGSTIGSVLIFTHGAGSLVVGTALSQNMCVFGSNTRWYSAMAPFGGAKAADEGLNLCASFSAMENILKDLKVCKGKDKDKLHPGTIAQQSTYSSATVSRSDALSFARSNLDGAMCGHDSSGLSTGVGTGLADIDSYVWFGEDRDGWMKLSECTTAHTSSWAHHNTNVWADIHMYVVWWGCWDWHRMLVGGV